MDKAGRARGRWTGLRIGGAAAVIASVLAACGLTGSDAGPPVIRLVGGGETATATAEAARADDATGSLTWRPIEYRFDLADSARFDAGEAPAWRLEPPADLRDEAADLADRLGLDGVSDSPGGDGGLTAGAQDGSGPTLWVGAAGDWSYHDPSGHVAWSCAEPIRPDVDAEGQAAPDDRSAEEAGETGCEPPEPPVGVPSAAQAEALATDLLETLGTPGRLAGVEATSTEWGAWVQARLDVDGLPTDLHVSAAYGGDARLLSASGTLARPVAVGDYPTVDADEALERLRERPWLGGLWSAMPYLRADQAASAPVGSPDEAVSSDTADEPRAEPMPLPDPAEPTEPEVISLTLVEVERVLALVADAERAMWLLPAYRFHDDQGGSWQTLAIADDYLDLDVPEPDVAPVPGDSEPVDDEPIPDGDPPASDVDAPDDLEALAQEVVGLSEAEATDTLAAAGATVRVVARDGEHFAVTEDYRTDRVNLTVVEGRVTEATVG